MINRLINNKYFQYFSLISGSILFCLSESLLKLSAKTYTTYEILLYRSSLLILFLIIITALMKKIADLKTQNIKMHLLRSLFSAGSMLFATKALSGLQLYTYKALYFLYPILLTILGIFMFKEKLKRQHITSLIVCLLGIFIAFKPGNEAFSLYGLNAIGAAFCVAMAVLVFKKMPASETISAVIFYYSLCCIGIALLFVDYRKIHIDTKELILFSSMALLHIMASFLYTYGLRIHNLTTISLMSYLTLPISMMLGWFIWQDLPSLNVFIASIMITFSNLILIKKPKAKQ